MTTTKNRMKAAADIIVGSAVEKLAEVHGTTTDAIYVGLAHGHPKLVDQFAVLVQAGAREAHALHDAGRISLTGDAA